MLFRSRCNKVNVIPLHNSKKVLLLKALEQFPLGREAIEVTSKENADKEQEKSQTFLPVTTFNVSSVTKVEQTQISDSELSSALYGDSPSFQNEAEVSDRVLEASGLEIPTRIYASAEEAIDLSTFEPHVRPYIKRLFLDLYPDCVSLHSLDAGNLSLTLGYVKLKIGRAHV